MTESLVGIEHLRRQAHSLQEKYTAWSAVPVVLLLATCSYALYVHRDALFWHLDGYMIRQTIDWQFKWLPGSLALGLDPLRGPGTLFFPMNARLRPIFVVQELLFGGHISRFVTYAAYAVQTILVMCLLARHCGLSAKIGALGGLIVILLTMPFIWTQQTTLMFPLFVLTPHWFDLLAVAVLLFVLYGHIGRGSLPAAVSLSALCAVIVFFAIAASPLWAVLFAPYLGAVVSAHLLMTSGSERLAKGAAAVSIVAALYFSGVLEFAYATVGSGAVRIFGPEIETYQSGRWWSSMIYQYDRFPVGALTASCGLLVALACTRRSMRRQANTALKAAALLTGVAGCICLSAWDVLGRIDILEHQLRQVRLFYFELPLLPFYALFAAVGIDRGLQLLTKRCAKPRLVADVVVTLLVIAAVLPGLHGIRDNNPYPQLARATPITTLLEKEVGLSVGSTFRGRVATIFSGADWTHKAVSWDGMVAHDVARYAAQQNDHRFVGLWEFQIPTLQEYSQMITPGTYFWITRAMSVAADKQDMRNHAIITRASTPLMKLFGVRYLISPQAIEDSQLTLRTIAAGGDRLYELANANVGQYYAHRVARVESFGEMLHAMRTTESMLDTTWTNEAVAPTLSPGRVEITFVPSGIHVRGTSDGTTLMLLPFTFSRCFSLTVNAGDQAPRMLRANLNMLGLQFTGRLDATLILTTGPFTKPGCLVADTRELQRLGIDEAAREFPRGSLIEPN